MYYLIEYTLPTNNKPRATFCSYVIADNPTTAKVLLKYRRMGEKLLLYTLNGKRIGKAAKLYKERKLLECIHLLTFAGNTLINAKLIKPKDLLADNGIIHDILHEHLYPEDNKYSPITLKRLKEFDRLAEEVGY